MNLKILRATAIYSGGNIYLYYAELEDKNWIIGDGYSFIIVNASPLENADVFDESCYPEWQQTHLVKEISDDEHQGILNDIIDAIFAGKIIEGWGNFSKVELESRRTTNKR